MSPLQKAIEKKDLPSVRRLLTESPDLIDECIGPKHTPPCAPCSTCQFL